MGADTASVRPHRPGLRMLPSSMARYTAVHDPPVAATSTAASARAPPMQMT